MTQSAAYALVVQRVWVFRGARSAAVLVAGCAPLFVRSLAAGDIGVLFGYLACVMGVCGGWHDQA